MTFLLASHLRSSAEQRSFRVFYSVVLAAWKIQAELGSSAADFWTIRYELVWRASNSFQNILLWKDSRDGGERLRCKFESKHPSNQFEPRRLLPTTTVCKVACQIFLRGRFRTLRTLAFRWALLLDECLIGYTPHDEFLKNTGTFWPEGKHAVSCVATPQYGGNNPETFKTNPQQYQISKIHIFYRFASNALLLIHALKRGKLGYPFIRSRWVYSLETLKDLCWKEREDFGVNSHQMVNKH